MQRYREIKARRVARRGWTQLAAWGISLGVGSEPRRYRLVCDEELDACEIVHFAEGDHLVTSFYGTVRIERGGSCSEVALPEPAWRRPFGASRLARRALRLDKCNVVPVGGGRRDLVIVRQGEVYHYDSGSGQLAPVLQLRNCRNVLHQSIAVLNDTEVVFGEYGSNPERRPVPIYRSEDAGRTWRVAFEFPAGKTRHVHGCYWDEPAQQFWVFTGDLDGEVQLVRADRQFEQVEWLGDTTQVWRAVNAFFRPEAVYWIMDAPEERNFVVRFDRVTRKLEKRPQEFPGPVWYGKELSDGLYLAATACELGIGVLDSAAHVFVSRDLEHWDEVASFPWDGWPKGYFKFGVVGFADGRQSSREFYVFGEALKGLDGRAWRCRLEER
jgi:hypothetical protein